MSNVVRCSYTSSRGPRSCCSMACPRAAQQARSMPPYASAPALLQARGCPRHLSRVMHDASPTLCALGRREAARLWCPPPRAPPSWVRGGGRSSRHCGLRRSRRGSRPWHRGKRPGCLKPSPAAAVDT